jgi:hypothetical protein
MTDEQRRGFDNLLLLCLPHAEEIDLPALAERYPWETLVDWKTAQVASPPAGGAAIPDNLVPRAEMISVGDVLLDFRDAVIDLGGKPGLAPGAGGSGGGAIGLNAHGGSGGPGGDVRSYAVTGAEVLGDVEITIGRGGRGGVEGMPGEAGGHTRFGDLVTPGGGRRMHQPFPAGLTGAVEASIAAALFTNYAEVVNGLGYLSGTGWSSYRVRELPGAFVAGLCVWMDVSWSGVQEGVEIPVEVIIELLTPSETATFSEAGQVIIRAANADGFGRYPLLFSLAGTLHDVGRHVLAVSTNTGALLGQYLDVVHEVPDHER